MLAMSARSAGMLRRCADMVPPEGERRDPVYSARMLIYWRPGRPLVNEFFDLDYALLLLLLLLIAYPNYSSRKSSFFFFAVK